MTTPTPMLSMPLQSLPLRPSTLTALMRSGLATTGDVLNSLRAKEASPSTLRGVDGDGCVDSNNATTINTSCDGTGNFASDVGCSASQAADYAREIDDALSSVGLPRLTSDENGGASSSCVQEDGGAENSNIMPATAASILRRSRMHRGNSGGNGARAAPTRHIVSFSQELDRLLGGGVALSELTEIVGLPGAGKTQLAMQLSVDARLPASSGGVEGCAVVIDAEGSWTCSAGVDRLHALSEAMVTHVKRGADRKIAAARARDGPDADVGDLMDASSITVESVLAGVHVFRVHDEASQKCTLESLPAFLTELEERGSPAKLVVVDSIAFHYRVASSSSSFGNNGGKGNSISTTHNLTRMAAFLTELAYEFDLAVVAMNHLTTRIESNNSDSTGGAKLVPALGESWAHSITSRLMIEQHSRGLPSSGPHDMGEVRKCTLVKSPHKPYGEALLMITDKGIRGMPRSYVEAGQTEKRQRTG